MHTGDNSYKHIMWRIKNENINKSNKIWRIMCRSTEREENKKREQQMEKINSKKNVALLSTSSTASYSSRHSHLANTFFSAVAFSRRHWSCKCKKRNIHLFRLSWMAAFGILPLTKEMLSELLCHHFFCHRHWSVRSLALPLSARDFPHSSLSHR